MELAGMGFMGWNGLNFAKKISWKRLEEDGMGWIDWNRQEYDGISWNILEMAGMEWSRLEWAEIG